VIDKINTIVVIRDHYSTYVSSNDECRHYSVILCEKDCDIDMMDDIIVDSIPFRMERERYSSSSGSSSSSSSSCSRLAQVRETMSSAARFNNDAVE
jgi:hypothetical protein